MKMISSLPRRTLFLAFVLLLLLPLLIFSLIRSTNFRSKAATGIQEAETSVLSGSITVGSDSLASGGKYLAFGSTSAGSVSATTRSDGAILINNTPVFLHGFYHDSDDGRQNQYLLDDLRTIAGAGFNVMHPVVTELPDTVLYRSEAPKLGMWTVAAFYKPALTSIVTQLKNDLSIIAWDIADDFSSPPGNPAQSPTLVKSRHDAVKSIAPHHLTYGAAGSDPVYQNEKWLGTMDVMGMENYPVSNNWSDYHTEMEYSIAMYLYSRKNLGESQSLLALPQTFAWPNGRMPTPQEVRNMTYGALIARMNGIIYYTYNIYGSLQEDLPTRSPVVWDETKKLQNDISLLTPALLNGTYTQFDSACNTCSKFPGRIHAAFYKEGNKTYIIVVNTAQQNQTVSIPLPPSPPGTLTSLFPTDIRYNSSLTVTNNTLQGTLKSLEIGVYLFTSS